MGAKAVGGVYSRCGRFVLGERRRPKFSLAAGWRPDRIFKGRAPRWRIHPGVVRFKPLDTARRTGKIVFGSPKPRPSVSGDGRASAAHGGGVGFRTLSGRKRTATSVRSAMHLLCFEPPDRQNPARGDGHQLEFQPRPCGRTESGTEGEGTLVTRGVN